MEKDKLLKFFALLTVLTVISITGYHAYGISETPEERKVAVIVLDGADFQVLDQLKEEGEIPNIKKLEQNGLSTEYRTPEAFSPQGWTKMGTGMSTENISVERKWSYETENGNEKRLDSNAIENRRFWSYLNEDGIETGIYQWMISWPVEPVKGFMTSSYLTGDLKNMSYPEDINISNEDLKRSLVLFDTFDVANKLTEEYYGMDVLVYGFHVSDRLQHGFWKFVDDEDSQTQEYRDLMHRPYEEVDQLVGELRPEYTVILVSDHGFAEPWTDTYQADINDVLRQIDLTNYSTEQRGMAREKIFSSDAKIAHRYHENEVLNNTHYRVRFEILDSSSNQEDIEQKLMEINYPDGNSLLTDINYSEGSFEALMYIHPDYRSEEYLEERLMRMSYARGELPILQQNITLNYKGQELVSKLGPKQTGGHPPRTNGVFYIAGEGIKQEGRTDISIKAEDLAPVILHLKGSEIPNEMDGEVPEEIFKSSYSLINSPKFSDREVKREEFNLDIERDSEQDGRINDRLDELGYLQ